MIISLTFNLVGRISINEDFTKTKDSLNSCKLNVDLIIFPYFFPIFKGIKLILSVNGT